MLLDLRGKTALVTGIANNKSIAWGIAQQLHAAGAELGVTYLPDEKGRFEGKVRELTAPLAPTLFEPLNVQDPAQIEAVFETLHASGGRAAGEKLINELGWRDFWQRVWRRLGDGIWDDQEPLKTDHSPASYASELPADLAEARTGLACMDAFARELVDTGWLHNHARMWLAAYVVHWRRVRWQAGARWFLQHLLDGDPASNNLSWQWVASSFSHKPYIFNRANLERYSGGVLCARCEAAAKGSCPFDASYEALQERLFAPGAR